MNLLKKIIYACWIGVIILLIGLFIVNPTAFSPKEIADLLLRYERQALFIFTLICFIRGFFLIPSTPFVLAGIALFPSQPWTIFAISLAGIVFGSTVLYYFSDFLGFSKKLEEKYPKKIALWHKRLNSPKASLIVIAWSFFPLVPTDIICYVAGIVKMPYRYLISGVIIGEALLIYLYVFFSKGILEFLM